MGEREPLYIVPDAAKVDPESPDYDTAYVEQLNTDWPYVDPDTGQRYKNPGTSTGFPEAPHEPVALVHVDELDEGGDEGGDAEDADEPERADTVAELEARLADAKAAEAAADAQPAKPASPPSAHGHGRRHRH